MRGLPNDLRLSLRALAARPGTSALALAALALGIGLTTTMFSIVQGAFLRGLPFEHSERIVYIGRTDPQRPLQANATSAEDFLDWRRDQRSLEELAGFTNTQAVVTAGLAPERYRAARFTSNMLHLLRVAPVAGRDFTDADAAPGAPAVALISDTIWASQFSRARSAIGAVVRINGTPTEVIGVLPPKFGFPQTQDLWLPLEVRPAVKRGSGPFIDVVGRLREGTSVDRADADLRRVAASLAAQIPENKGVGASVAPFIRRFLGADVIATLTTMLAAVFGVLLIACANVMSLQLARAADRARDIAVRTALGASRARVVRQLLVEGLLLSVLGAAAGLALAATGIWLFNRQVVSTNPPFWIDIRIDAVVLLFAIALAVVSAVASSLVPALRATRQDVNAVLKDEGRANSGLRMGRFTRSLVIGEVLLSCILLVVSGLMIRSVVNLGTLRYPFATSDVFSAGLAYDDVKYAKETDRAALAVRIEERLSRVPGVVRAALSNGVPTPGGGTPFSIEGQSYASDSAHPRARLISGTPGFFDVLRVKVLRGRGFETSDTFDSQPVAVVGEDFARRFFPGTDPIGRRIQIGVQSSGRWWTIVGIVPSLAVAGTPDDVTEFVYRPIAQTPNGLNIIASTSGDPRALTESIRRAVTEVDPDVAVFNADSVAASLAQRAWAFRVFGALFTSFGLAALIMAAAGLYGVMAFSVRTRTQEIGIRMALGADRSRVLRVILWQGMWRALLGIAIGLPPAWKLGGLMSALLYHVTPADPLVLGTTVGVLSAAAFAASVVPALRAAAVDPIRALRHT